MQAEKVWKHDIPDSATVSVLVRTQGKRGENVNCVAWREMTCGGLSSQLQLGRRPNNPSKTYYVPKPCGTVPAYSRVNAQPDTKRGMHIRGLPDK